MDQPTDNPSQTPQGEIEQNRNLMAKGAHLYPNFVDKDTQGIPPQRNLKFADSTTIK